MKNKWLKTGAFLLLGIFSFFLYNNLFDYVIAFERESSVCFFMFSRQFLAGFLGMPGGLVGYAGCFFSQFYHYTWLGALTISVLVVGFAVLFHLAVKRRLNSASVFYTLLPCLLLLTATSNVIHTALRLMVAIGPFLIYLWLPKGAARRVYALTAIPALYLLTGGCFWLFVFWVVAAEWLDHRPSAGLAWKLLYPALAAGIVLAAWRWLFLIPLRNAFLEPMIFARMTPLPDLALYAYVALMPFWAMMLSRMRPGRFGNPRRSRVAQAAALAAVGVALIWTNYDPARHELDQYNQLYQQRRWQEILAKAQANPSESLLIQFFTNCALYHEGKLLDDLFHYPQGWGTRGLILHFTYIDSKSQDDTDRAMYNSDLFFEMGHVNAALLLAFDHMTLRGMTYANVRRMAECCMVDGAYDTARLYLSILKRTLFYRDFARRCEGLLLDPEACDRYFASGRARLPTVELTMDLEGFVLPLTLLKSHPHNRMAFDYLMAWCMLDKWSLWMLPDNLGYLDGVGYKSVPGSLQEALLLLEEATGRPAGPPGLQYDERIVARFNAFAERLRQHPNDAFHELQPEFSDTGAYYWKFIAPPPSGFNYAYRHWWVANEFRAAGMIEDAITHYRHALRLDPDFAEAHASLAEILKSQGRLEEAAFHAAEARRLRHTVPAIQPTPPGGLRTE